MPDLETEVQEQTTTEEPVEETDEVSETTDEKAEESEQETVETEKDTEDPSDETDEEYEVWDSEAEYIKKFVDDEDFETVGDLAKAYKDLKANPPPETRREYEPPETHPQPEQKSSESYFPTSPFGDTVELLKKEGLIADAEVEKNYRAMAQFSDRAFSPMVKQFEQAFNMLADGFMRNQEMLRDSSWGAFASKGKPGVRREELDKILDNPPVARNGQRINTYAQAAQYYFATDPDRLAQMRKASEQEGFKKGQKKVRIRGANRRSKPSPDSGTTMASFNAYLDDEGKLNSMVYNRLSPEKQLKIAEDLEAHLRKQQKG